MNKQPIDNGPNRDKLYIDFDTYRTFMDTNDGIMRRGLFNIDTFDEALRNNGTLFAEIDKLAVPIMVPNNVTHEFDQQFVGENALIMHEFFAGLAGELPENVVIQRQKVVSDAFTQRVFSPTEEVNPADFNVELAAPEGEELVAEYGLPEYMIVTVYDTTDTDAMKNSPCEDILTRHGHRVTTDRAKQLERLDELVKLHTDVFEGQAAQIGYYAGLDAEKIEELINNPDFIPITAFDKDTGEPLMFALFSPSFTDFESIDWMNAGKVHEIVEKYSGDSNCTVALPMVVTSRFNGLGLLGAAVRQSIHETVNRTKCDRIVAVYETNAFSVLVTPKIMTKSLATLGVPSIYQEIEATYLTKQKSTAE
jgi:hypothetical protein